MKLSKKRLLDVLMDGSAYKASKKSGISVGYVYKLRKKYNQTGEIPVIGISAGRPKRIILNEEEEIVRKSYETYRISASRLRGLIRRDYNVDLPHYHIYKILLKLGFSKPKENKDVRKKKWKRYERKHSLTAVHMDWYYDKEVEGWVLPVLDDASRKLLALIECDKSTTDFSIDAIKEALKHGEIQQCITDHGTQFTKDENDNARFPAFLEQQKIKHILCRIKHPQSNGKAEKFNDTYRIHRHAFKTKKEFMHWYNEVRPHMSLNEEIFETPEMAYQRMKKEGRVYFT